MIKLIKYGGFIGSVLCMFVIPLWYLIVKYQRVEVVEVTTKTVFPLPILIVVVVLILVTIIGLAVWLFAMWLKQATKDSFSFLVIAPFGLVFFAVTWVFNLLVVKFRLLIEDNSERFITDLQGYEYSLGVVMIWVAIGLGIGTISAIAIKVNEYKKSNPI